MLYVERNEQGEIVAIRRDNHGEVCEMKEAMDEEILAEFLLRGEMVLLQGGSGLAVN